MSNSDSDYDESVNPFENMNARDKARAYYSLIKSEVYCNDIKRMEKLHEFYAGKEGYLSNMKNHEESKGMPAKRKEQPANRDGDDIDLYSVAGSIKSNSSIPV